MLDYLKSIFSVDFMPHGHCFLWSPDILWTHVISDAIIALSYYSIPIALLVLLKKRTDLFANWIFRLFAVFILLCGTTHIFEIWTIWEPVYRLQGIIKIFTALASGTTAFLLWPLLPRVIALPSSEKLWKDLSEQQQVRATLQRKHSELEGRVIEQTAQLSVAVKELRRLAAIIDSCNDAIIDQDLNGKIISWNSAAEKMFGCVGKKMIGATMSQFFAPDAYKVFLDQNATVRGGGNSGPFLLESHQLDGTPIVVSLTVSQVLDESGALEGLSLIARDVTERRRLEERFRIAVEAAPNAMLLASHDGKILLANHESEKLFGYSVNELVGMSVDSLVPERFRHKHASYRDHFVSAPETRPMGKDRDLFALRKDGSEFPVEIGLTPIESKEGPMIISAIVDITERKIAQEKLKNSLKEKELLLKEIHHRVKNNMQVISSLLRLQARQVTDEEAQSLFQESEARVQSMALVHEKLYKSEGANRVDFKSYVEQLATNLFHTYVVGPNKVELKLNIENVELSIDRAIPCGLLLNELISNSFKHAFPGNRGGVVTIELHREGSNLVLMVSDDGAGIAQSVDLDSPSTLGLRVVRTLCEQLGANLTLERRVGTMFKVAFAAETDTESNEQWGNYGKHENSVV